MQNLIKKWGKHLAALIIFLGLTLAYFSPAIVEGKVLRQSDMERASEMGHTQMEQYEKTAEPGEFSVWSDAMFGGMPYVTGYGEAAPALPKLQWLEKPFKGVGYLHAGIILTALICFYILMCVMGVNWWLALAGAIAFAFASYNMIIIHVGHITKAYAIAYMPLTLAGMALLFRNKYVGGAILFLLGVAFSISNGHIQITYYLVLLCLFVYLGYLFLQIRKKNFREIGLVTGIMVMCVLLATLPNARKLYGDWDLGQHSTRGPTELTTTSSEGEKISSGLDKQYAFAWSYGRGELLTLLIPNAYGGSTGGAVGTDSELYKELRARGAQVGSEVRTYTYWGDKSFTEGPVYFGAVVCFLFIFGMFVIRNPMKWWLFAGALFLTFVALGRNMDWLNDFLFHHLPLFNKFRAVEMALVIPGLAVPAIAIWEVNELINGRVDQPLFKKGFFASLGIAGGLCLIVWILPDLLLNFQSSYDAYYQLPDWYYQALVSDRAALASADALRSLIFILLAAGSLYLYSSVKDKQKFGPYVAVGILVLTMADLWSVDKRYLDNNSFITKKADTVFPLSTADKIILEDPALSYRVLNLNRPFEETSTSRYHHSIGGYYAAKLRRYQELIEHRLSKEVQTLTEALQQAETVNDLYSALDASTALNMLNTRYIIYNPEQPPIENPFGYENAWFVDKVNPVENADAEIAALNTLNPLQEAITDKRFSSYLEGLTLVPDSNAMIELESYRPNKLTYISNTASEQFAVFSEIYYYPGWQAYIDGKPVDHIRVDWTLRGLRIPAGTHEIVFEFRPKGYIIAANVTAYSSFLILLLVIATIGYSFFKMYKGKDKQED